MIPAFFLLQDFGFCGEPIRALGQERVEALHLAPRRRLASTSQSYHMLSASANLAPQLAIGLPPSGLRRVGGSPLVYSPRSPVESVARLWSTPLEAPSSQWLAIGLPPSVPPCQRGEGFVGSPRGVCFPPCLWGDRGGSALGTPPPMSMGGLRGVACHTDARRTSGQGSATCTASSARPRFSIR